MSLSLYNTLTNKKEVFKSIEPNMVGMYVCGITVYDHCHLGHARAYVAFDVLARYLKYLGYGLNYVRNITDVEDKIIKKAIENSETISSITNRYILSMNKDFKVLIHTQNVAICNRGNCFRILNCFFDYFVLNISNVSDIIQPIT
mgnify:CR=1 FL=1